MRAISAELVSEFAYSLPTHLPSQALYPVLGVFAALKQPQWMRTEIGARTKRLVPELPGVGFPSCGE